MVKLTPAKKMNKNIMKGYGGQGEKLNLSQPGRSRGPSPYCISFWRQGLTGMILPMKTLQEAKARQESMSR